MGKGFLRQEGAHFFHLSFSINTCSILTHFLFVLSYIKISFHLLLQQNKDIMFDEKYAKK